ncbi:MAG: hypothetical protein ACLGPM_07570 [Acidobacteriota bacterium]
MTRFVVIATANRGPVNPAEPLDETGQHMARLQFEADAQQERKIRARRWTHYLIDDEASTRKPMTHAAAKIRKKRTA